MTTTTCLHRIAAAWQDFTSRARRRLVGDEGMATAEYAMATVAAVAFAGVLLVVLKSNAVKSALSAVITSALS